MSVTKWVHLNWGDDGIRKLFTRAYELLEDGGLFIVEPQPWKSYRKKYALTSVRLQCRWGGATWISAWV